jgi:hypothetical protein
MLDLPPHRQYDLIDSLARSGQGKDHVAALDGAVGSENVEGWVDLDVAVVESVVQGLEQDGGQFLRGGFDFEEDVSEFVGVRGLRFSILAGLHSRIGALSGLLGGLSGITRRHYDGGCVPFLRVDGRSRGERMVWMTRLEQ